MAWHEDAGTRQKIGNEYEQAFAEQVICRCGGQFNFIGNSYPGCPDFQCGDCGQLVDVKGSPQFEQTGNISVSAIPWGNYPSDLLLVTCIRSRWIGEYKKYIFKISDVFLTTHHSKHSYLGNTNYRLISWKEFRDLDSIGYGIR